MKFDPTDQELLDHLKEKVRLETTKLHPLIDEFIPTIEGDTGICYTHPEKLPGNSSTACRERADRFPVKANPTSDFHLYTIKRYILRKVEIEGGREVDRLIDRLEIDI